MPRLLLVHHSPGTALPVLLEAVGRGMSADGLQDVSVQERAALELTASDMRDADGYLFATPANFGYMSGALKHAFDSVFLDVGGSLDARGGAAASAGVTSGRPFGLLVHGNNDVTGAVRSVLAITRALGWRQVAPVLETIGPVTEQDLAAAYELGGTVAATLAEGF